MTVYDNSLLIEVWEGLLSGYAVSIKYCHFVLFPKY